ncbi:MAG TPA: hypothetical protein VLF71_03815 [Candidatus Saccharimonadales bacterium]|nr:hypothetical protein [Candidatus Saccharimonadales bacterium]
MNTRTSSGRLLLRCFLPSLLSASLCVLLALILVGIHTLLLSNNSGVFAPGVFGQQSGLWVAAYSAHVLQPLDSAVHNSVVNTVLLAGIWGILGCAVLGVVGLAVDFVRSLRAEEKSVTLSAAKGVVQHPLRRTFFMYWLWRFFVGMAAVLATAALLPVVRNLLLRDAVLLQSASAAVLFRDIAVVCGAWAGILHGYVVCLRLFMLRTRVFGETIY